MHRILGDLWSAVSNPYYQAVPWKGRGEGRGEKERGEEEGRSTPYTIQHSPQFWKSPKALPGFSEG